MAGRIAYQDLERVAPPPPAEFLQRYVRAGRPVVLAGLGDDWPARRRWSVEYLARACGDAHVVAVAMRDGRLETSARGRPEFVHVALQDVLASLDAPGGAAHYVATPLGALGPLRRDLSPPVYCAGASWLRAKLWLGGAGTVTPLHWDLPHNLHSVVTGAKRFVLFAPRQRRSLYGNSLFSRMPNFSRVDLDRPDVGRFPRLDGAQALVGVVRPGDAIFIPRLWWHHTRSLETGISVNFWWGGPTVRLASAAALVFKRVRGIYRNEWASGASSATNAG